MIYRIKGPYGSETRKRCNAAQLVLERMTYDAIAANGGLDTAWGHRAMNQARSMDWNKGGCVSSGHFTIFCTRSHS